MEDTEARATFLTSSTLECSQPSRSSGTQAKRLLDTRTERPAARPTLAALHLKGIASRCECLDFDDPPYVDDERPVHADELVRVELRLQRRQGGAHHLRCVPDVETDVVRLGLDDINVFGGDEPNPRAHPYGEPLQPLALRLELIEQAVEILTVFNEGVGARAGIFQLVGVSLADQVWRDAASLTGNVRDDVTPQVGRCYPRVRFWRDSFYRCRISTTMG